MNQPEGRTLWDRVGEGLQEWYSEARGWTGEKARIGVKKVDILGIQHNIKRSMTHLGGRVYDLMQRDLPIDEDEQVQQIMRDLRGFEDELAAREREIEDLRSSRRAADEAPTDSPDSETIHATSSEAVEVSEVTASGETDSTTSTKP